MDIDVDKLPFVLKPGQRARLYLHEWQQENCSRLGANPDAQKCCRQCDLPSVGMIEIGTRVKHNAAQRARETVKNNPEGCCLVKHY